MVVEQDASSEDPSIDSSYTLRILSMILESLSERHIAIATVAACPRVYRYYYSQLYILKHFIEIKVI